MKYDLILVQSETDRTSLCKLSSGLLKQKVIVVPNGVEWSLFDNVYTVNNMNLLFVGSLRGYSKIVQWLLEKVWPSVKKKNTGASFRIVGKGATRELEQLISMSEGVVHVEYMEDIKDVYKGVALSMSPVFKKYGLINKVIESMAAGVPVVADEGGFNAIPGFIDGKHGAVANDAASMVDKINGLLESVDKRAEISNEARLLVRQKFSWEDRVKSVDSKLNQIILSK